MRDPLSIADEQAADQLYRGLFPAWSGVLPDPAHVSWISDLEVMSESPSTFNGVDVVGHLRARGGAETRLTDQPGARWLIGHTAGHFWQMSRQNSEVAIGAWLAKRGLRYYADGHEFGELAHQGTTQENIADEIALTLFPDLIGTYGTGTEQVHGPAYKFTAAMAQEMAALMRAFPIQTIPWLSIEDIISAAGGTMRHPDPAGYLLGPGGSRVSSPFGPRPSLGDFHTGIDLALAAGDAVYAVRSGVVSLDDDNGAYDPGIPATFSGIAVKVTADDGEVWWYCHLDRNVVTLGQRLERGQLLGYIGTTGAALGPHLHLERQVGGTPVDGMEELIVLSSEGQQQIRSIVSEEVAKGSRATAETITAGFNVTLPVVARKIIRSVVFLITGKLALRDPSIPYPDDLTPL